MAAGTARCREVVAVNAENRRLSLTLIVGGGSFGKLLRYPLAYGAAIGSIMIPIMKKKGYPAA